MLAVGGGGGEGDGGVGPDSGGWRAAGGDPGPLARPPLPPPFRPLGAGLSFGPSPTVPSLPASSSPRRVAPAGGEGGGGGGRWGRRSRSAVSGHWSTGQRGSRVARIRVPSPRTGVVLVLPLCGQRGGGGGRSGSGGLGLLGGCPGPGRGDVIGYGARNRFCFITEFV